MMSHGNYQYGLERHKRSQQIMRQTRDGRYLDLLVLMDALKASAKIHINDQDSLRRTLAVASRMKQILPIACWKREPRAALCVLIVRSKEYCASIDLMMDVVEILMRDFIPMESYGTVGGIKCDPNHLLKGVLKYGILGRLGEPPIAKFKGARSLRDDIKNVVEPLKARYSLGAITRNYIGKVSNELHRLADKILDAQLGEFEPDWLEDQDEFEADFCLQLQHFYDENSFETARELALPATSSVVLEEQDDACATSKHPVSRHSRVQTAPSSKENGTVVARGKTRGRPKRAENVGHHHEEEKEEQPTRTRGRSPSPAEVDDSPVRSKTRASTRVREVRGGVTEPRTQATRQSSSKAPASPAKGTSRAGGTSSKRTRLAVDALEGMPYTQVASPSPTSSEELKAASEEQQGGKSSGQKTGYVYPIMKRVISSFRS